MDVAIHVVGEVNYLSNICKPVFLLQGCVQLANLGGVKLFEPRRKKIELDVYKRQTKAYIRELQAVSRNINQIAKRANATGTVYRQDIEDIKKAVDEIWPVSYTHLRRLMHYSDAKNPGFPGFFCKSFTMSFSIFLWIVSVAFSLGNA